jgi:hypothetical protein
MLGRYSGGEWMTMPRWLIAAAIACIAATGCSEADGEASSHARRPQQAGATNPLATAGHLAGIEATGLTGDQRAVQGHVDAMHLAGSVRSWSGAVLVGGRPAA